MGLDKRGTGKNILLAFLIAVPTTAIILFFLSQESQTGNGLSWAQCRQSLLVRNAMPEWNLAGGTISTKGTLPLKCGTQTINIDYKDAKRAESEIAKTISSCWYMVGKGTFRVFPGAGSVFGKEDTPCIVCARIHLNENVKKYYTGENKIDIKNGLDSSLQGNKRTAWEYLNPDSGNKAFMYFRGWSTEGFSVDVQKEWPWGSIGKDRKAFSFPRYLDPERGDLFVVYSEPVKGTFSSDETGKSKRGMEPYMILTQYANFEKLSEAWAVQIVPSWIVKKLREKMGCNIKNLPEPCSQNFRSYETKVCSSIESVPS